MTWDKMKALATITALVLFTTPLMALAGDSHWNTDLTLGGGASLTSKGNSKAFPEALELNGNAIYMLNDHVGLAPLALTIRHFVSRVHNAHDIIQDGLQMPAGTSVLLGDPATFQSDAKSWSLSYTPGLFLRSGNIGDNTSLFGQIGAGVDHIFNKVDVMDFNGNTTQNRFDLLLGTGLEVKAGDRAGFVGRINYNWVNTPGQATHFLDFTGGVSYYF